MGNIIIRKARQDYVCDVCGHIIRAGQEYLDKVITHDTKVVRHERYHDDCPYSNNDTFDKFIRKFIKSTGMIAVEKKTGVKVRVMGISNYPAYSVELADWGFSRIPDVSIERFVEEYDYE